MKQTVKMARLRAASGHVKLCYTYEIGAARPVRKVTHRAGVTIVGNTSLERR